MNDKVVKIEFNIWANNEEEGEALKKAFADFVDWHGQQGVKVTASKLLGAIDMWNSSRFSRNAIINYLRQ